MSETPAGPQALSVLGLVRCGDHPQFGTSVRDTLQLGCGCPLTEETDDRLAYRCAQCRTVFCRSCIRQHFGWPTAGGGPMPHALDTALATSATTPESAEAGHPRTYSLVGGPHPFLVTDDESGINLGFADKIGGPLVAPLLAARKEGPDD